MVSCKVRCAVCRIVNQRSARVPNLVATEAFLSKARLFLSFFKSSKGQGTYLETPDGKLEPRAVSNRQPIEALYLVASRTHRDERFKQLLERLPFKDRNYVGSVGCKIGTILEHQSDVYISLSGKSAAKDWDFAAPELILTEAGGKFTYFNGDAVKYNQGDVIKWGGIMASNGHCHESLCQLSTQILEEIDRGGKGVI